MKKFVFLLLLFKTIPVSAMLLRLAALHAKPHQARSLAQINNAFIKVPRRICTTLVEQRGQKVDFQEIDKKIEEAQKKEIRALGRSMECKAALTLLIPPIIAPALFFGGIFGAISLCHLVATPVCILTGNLYFLKYSAAAYAKSLITCGVLKAGFALEDYIEAKGEENCKEATIERDLVEVLKKQRDEAHAIQNNAKATIHE